jgi:hypothetical protein
VLVDPTNKTIAEPTLQGVESAARAMALQIQVLNASNGPEIGAAFAAIERERPDALFVSIGTLARWDLLSYGNCGDGAGGKRHFSLVHWSSSTQRFSRPTF